MDIFDYLLIVVGASFVVIAIIKIVQEIRLIL